MSVKNLTKEDTIASIATAVGGAIGIVRVSGPEAIHIAKKIFVPKNKQFANGDYKSYRVYYGHVVDNKTKTENNTKNIEGAIIDEALLIVMIAPKTYTREDVIEIHCHGGLESLRRVLMATVSAGARIAEPGEFSKRAFLNGRIDLTRAEAVMDTVSAISSRALSVATSMLKGRLEEKINTIYEKLMKEIAAIEAYLDSPEHAFGIIQEDFTKENFCKRLDSIKEELCLLSQTYDIGRLIKEGVNTVIIGKPNVGKSSLLNMFLGQERAIVTDIPGTTRDLLIEHIKVGDIVLKLTDTAGVRFSHEMDIVEQIGVNRAQKAILDAELILFIIDGSMEITEEDIMVAKMISKMKKPVILLKNKSDLSNMANTGEILEKLGNITEVEISAKTRLGIDNLIKTIENMFNMETLLQERNEGSLIITNLRHAELLNKSINSIELTLETINAGLPEDFYTINLIDACEYLGEITGRNATEDLIDTVFSKFCMGK